MFTLRQYFSPFLFCLAALSGCDEAHVLERQEKVPASYIVAVNSPLYYFAQRLVGGEVEVRLPVPADVDPAQWQPTLDDLQQLQGAELVLLNGARYSPWFSLWALAWQLWAACWRRLRSGYRLIWAHVSCCWR